MERDSIDRNLEDHNVAQKQYMALAFDKKGKRETILSTKDDALASQLGKMVSPNHFKKISELCKKYHLTIGIRDTGEYSIKRIGQGAKGKPHTILEKSIKLSSVKKGYGEKAFDGVMEQIKDLDLEGFVGHWDEKGKLLGVRITNPPKGVITQQVPDSEPVIQYVPVDLDKEKGGPALQSLKNQEKWETHLFTGDYDLHEIYKNNRQIAEGSHEAAHCFTRINDAIAQADPERIGKFHVADGHTLHIDDEHEHALVQHGSQATYITNQIAEKNKSKNKNKAQLVKPVAQESDEPIAWCKNGNWYVTQDRTEHQDLRKQFKIQAPSCWEQESFDKMEKRTSLTLEYSMPSNSNAPEAQEEAMSALSGSPTTSDDLRENSSIYSRPSNSRDPNFDKPKNAKPKRQTAAKLFKSIN